MIDKVKAWCRICTIMRDCGEEEKVLRQKRKKCRVVKIVAIQVKEGKK